MRIFRGFNLLNPQECPHHKLILVLEWLEVLYFLEEVENTELPWKKIFNTKTTFSGS